MEDLKTLGRYQIRGVLGKGAMGLVYDGHDPGLDRRVAIKTILTSKLDGDTAKMYSLRFQREVRAVARLNHRNIVQVYDCGNEGDLAYIVMEHIQGRELKDYFDGSERFDLTKAFGMMIELLDALDFAHDAGIIHRDIKPGNVMIDAGGHVKLTDFGVARVNDPDGPQGEATRVGAVIGTPSYMSPEQVQGQTVDRRTDIFSAGIIFYQFLTWKKPFEGPGFALQHKIVTEDPVWPSTIVQVPPEFDRVVARALAKEAAQRYQTAGAFAAALKRILAGKPPEDPNEAASSLPPTPPTAAPAHDSEAEAEFWEGVKDSDDPEDLKLYIEQFPRGKFVAEAKKRIAALGG